MILPLPTGDNFIQWAAQLVDALSGLFKSFPKVTGTSSVQREIQFGTGTLTWSGGAASAFLTISHGLSDAPSVVVATVDGNGIANAYAQPRNLTATTFEVRGIDSVVRTGSNTVYWMAQR